MTNTELEILARNKIPCAETGITIKKTTCCICNAFSHCGMDAYVKDGRIIKIEGSADNPHTRGHLCPRGAGIRQYVYNKDRILTPLKRIGEKGKGEFRPISWEEAYAEIAERFNGYKKEYGAHSVAFFAGFSKWFRPVLQRLAGSFGSPNYMTEGSCCQEAHKQAWWLTFGNIAGPDIANADVVLVWTRNPFFSSRANVEWMIASFGWYVDSNAMYSRNTLRYAWRQGKNPAHRFAASAMAMHPLLRFGFQQGCHPTPPPTV